MPSTFYDHRNRVVSFYKMTLSLMKVYYNERPPNIARYRNSKNFNNVFINDLNEYFNENKILALSKELSIKLLKNVQL